MAMSSPLLLLLVYSPLVLSPSPSLSSVLSKEHMQPHMVIHTNTHPNQDANTYSCACMHRQTERWQGVILQDAGENRGRVGKERAREEGGKAEGGEKV